MADDETILGITRAVDTATELLGSDTPNWAPLRALLPLEDCDGFMWMGAVLQTRAVYVHGRHQERVIFQYKHGITRHYLMIDPTDLNTWWYLGDRGHVVIPREVAIEAAFEGLEILGATRSTRYDGEYRAQRNARLAAAGYTVIP
jgi:hypothetical protein